MRTTSWIVALAVAGASAPVVSAQDPRAWVGALESGVVRVEAVTRVAVSGLPGSTEGVQRTHSVAATGVVVDEGGLVVFALGALDPSGGAYALLGESVQPEVVRVRVAGADGRLREARWVGRDITQGLAFVRVGETEALAPVGFDAGALGVGSEAWVVARGPARFGRPLMVEPVRVSFVGRTELGVVRGIAPRLPHALGGVVVDAAGVACGLLLPPPALEEEADVLDPERWSWDRVGVVRDAATLAEVWSDPPEDVQTAVGASAPPAWLGVRAEIVTDALVEREALDFDYGVWIAEVYAGPARAAGLEEGDLLVEWDGLELDLTPGESFQDLVEAYGVGAVVEVVALRGEDELVVEVVLEPGPVRPRDAVRRVVAEAGLELRALTFFDRRAQGLEEGVEGAIVVGVEPDGAASRAGLRVEDRIVTVDGVEVGSLEDTVERLERAGAHDVELSRNGNALTLKIRR